jgi:hypothetical protein
MTDNSVWEIGPMRNFGREVNKSHVAVSTYPNIVTGENQ